MGLGFGHVVLQFLWIVLSSSLGYTEEKSRELLKVCNPSIGKHGRGDTVAVCRTYHFPNSFREAFFSDLKGLNFTIFMEGLLNASQCAQPWVDKGLQNEVEWASESPKAELCLLMAVTIWRLTVAFRVETSGWQVLHKYGILMLILLSERLRCKKFPKISNLVKD